MIELLVWYIAAVLAVLCMVALIGWRFSEANRAWHFQVEEALALSRDVEPEQRLATVHEFKRPNK